MKKVALAILVLVLVVGAVPVRAQQPDQWFLARHGGYATRGSCGTGYVVWEYEETNLLLISPDEQGNYDVSCGFLQPRWLRVRLWFCTYYQNQWFCHWTESEWVSRTAYTAWPF